VQHVVDTVGDGVAIVDREGRCLFLNPAAERILGTGDRGERPQEWATAFACYLVDKVTPYPPEDLPIARALRGETVGAAEVFVRNARLSDGMWLSVSARPLRDEAGAVESVAVVFREATARRHEREQIELLSSVVEQTADGVMVTDSDGRIEYVNPAFERITGYSRAEVLGRSPRILKSGAHSRQFYAGLWKALREGRVFRGTITDRRKDGEVFLAEQTITPMRGPGGGITHVVSVARDVTELRRAAQLEGELRLARSVQQRLYPVAPPRVPGLDIHGAAFVADVTGGDYFDFVSLPGDCLGLVIGDVSGHGVDSALLMAATRAVVRSTAQTSGEPAEILSVVNRILADDTEEHRFTTLLLAALHLPTRTIRYASAGHTPGYLLDSSGRVTWELAGTGPPLGLFPDAAFATSGPIALEPRDLLMLLTDGVTEAESADETPFGAERALEVVRGCRWERAAVIVERLYQAVRSFSDASPQVDDLTTVICRVDPGT
jgi:sigma-B regulation protein RsbU (phosphoserine phosphatase)